ncbi:hypothetical protein BJX76DRAFT_249897 [Aspergillus varians]
MMFTSSHPSCIVVTHVEKFVCHLFLLCCFPNRSSRQRGDLLCTNPFAHVEGTTMDCIVFLIVASPLEFCLVWVLVGVWSLFSCSSIRDVLLTR